MSASTVIHKPLSRHKTRSTLASMLIAAAGLSSPAIADDVSWNAGNGSWFNPNNWTPNGVPNLNDTIRIGNLPGVQNSTVLLGAPGSGYDFLEISHGMTLDMNGGELVSFGEAWIIGANSRLIVRPSGGPNEHDFQGELYLGAGAYFQMVDNAPVRVFGSSESHGTISGRGTFLVASTTPFNNNGVINPSNNGGITIIAGQPMANRAIDLDGNGGIGHLLLSTPFSVLNVNAMNLTDSFSGTVTMGSGTLLNMNLADGWTADAGSTFDVSSSIVGAAALINGGHFTFGGNLNIGGSQGHLRVLADTTLLGAADVSLGTDDHLEFDGNTTVDGGVYLLSQGGRIDFDGPAAVNGGTFSMVGNSVAQGSVNFNSATDWSGNANFTGVARQIGNATVSAPTVMNATTFDMDGNNNVQWNINSGLVVNAGSIELGSQQFDGTMNIGGGVVSRLTLNLADPAASWTMNGTMNLSGSGGLPVTRAAGSRMIVTGGLNATSGIVQVTADAAFQNADVSIANNSTLRMRGSTTVDADTTFVGTGNFQNGIGGVLLLNSGVSLSQVGLTNSSMLRIGEAGPGVASVDRFTSTAAAAWGVDVSGYLAGTQHDLLLVTGGIATLDGALLVTLGSLGGGAMFAPSVGDEFTILSALGGVSGTFSNDPVSQVGGLTYDWTVLYNPNTVVLRLESIVPAPGSIGILGLGGLLVARRRR